MPWQRGSQHSVPSSLFLSPSFVCVSGYRYFQQACPGCSAPWPAHICWTLHFTISRCHRREEKNRSKPRAGIVPINWRSVCLCISLCVYIRYIYIYISACIWELCMVRTDNYGRNASESLGNVTGFILIRVLFMFLGFGGLIGLGRLGFFSPIIGNRLCSCL